MTVSGTKLSFAARRLIDGLRWWETLQPCTYAIVD